MALERMRGRFPGCGWVYKKRPESLSKYLDQMLVRR